LRSIVHKLQTLEKKNVELFNFDVTSSVNDRFARKLDQHVLDKFFLFLSSFVTLIACSLRVQGSVEFLRRDVFAWPF